jgi:uncharacterized phage protein (TIGR02220 family)
MNKDKIDIINHINILTGRNYTYDSIELDVLLSEGYTYEEIKVIVDYKFKQWRNTEFEKYIRPITLFKNFKKYIDEYSNSKIPKFRNTIQKAKQFNWRLDKKP